MSLKKHIKEIASEQHSNLLSMDFEIIDDVSVGNYDFVLLYHEYAYPETNYTIGFQRQGRNFMDMGDQHIKSIPEDVNLSELRQLIPILQDWIDQYEKIIIGSYNPRNTEVYQKVFDRYGIKNREITPYTEDPNFKAIVLEK